MRSGRLPQVSSDSLPATPDWAAAAGARCAGSTCPGAPPVRLSSSM
ncbi:Uncharacterised protein [Bordetella pertussis]|nr:Uncharacterised protein [Bordetella pertussis]